MYIDYRELRDKKGISRNKLSERSGMAVETIRLLERNTGNPNIKTITKYLNALGYELKLVKK